jgi:hypothetical protein
VFLAYGGEHPICDCCGEDDQRFLTVDHVDGGGNRQKKQIGSKLYTWLRKHNFPPGFRLLCFNCNCARAIYGTCPHQCSTTAQRRAQPMIHPSIGRVVWFYQTTPDKPGFQPEAAMVTYVHGDRMVNLVVFGPYGQPRGVTSVPLVQPEDVNTCVGFYCTWMPFQVGQAQRHEPQPDPVPDVPPGEGTTGGPVPIVSM